MRTLSYSNRMCHNLLSAEFDDDDDSGFRLPKINCKISKKALIDCSSQNPISVRCFPLQIRTIVFMLHWK